jgi:serine/threonine protein kinase
VPAEAKADALIGTVLEGRFQIERLIGEGGMGRVYVADETRLRRRCALKVLLPELSADQGCVERFLREAQAIAQIHHENVVDIYHLGEHAGGEGGVVFFAMELLTGEDLETRLRDRVERPVTWEMVCQWMAQVAGAMAAVHHAGLIHRDLKPSNIFISRRRDGRDRIKLLDFGVVKTVNRAALTGTGAAIGTPYYMSPEQILALPLDNRSDIYSLGALFFEALAGRMVFLGEPLQVAMQHCNIVPPRLLDIAELDMPRELDELVQQMLAKDPSQRPQTMEEIEDFLLSLVPLQSSLNNSGSVRPITARMTGLSTAPLASLIDSGVAEGRPMTPSVASAGQAAALARTTLAPALKPASTVEITVEHDGGPRAKTRHLPLLIGAAGLIAAIATLWLLPRGDEPGPTPPTVVATPTPDPTHQSTPPTPPPDQPKPPTIVPVTPPAGPPDPPTTEPVPPDTSVKPAGEPRRKPEKFVPEPLRKIYKAATACRKTHKASKGPKMTVDYAIGSDGRVTRAVPATADALGKCLAAAVKQAKFPAQLKLGLKIDL